MKHLKMIFCIFKNVTKHNKIKVFSIKYFICKIFYVYEALNDFSSNQIIDILRKMKMKFDRNYYFPHFYMLNTKVNQYLIRFLKYMISHKELYLIIKEDVSRWNDGKGWYWLWRFLWRLWRNIYHVLSFIKVIVKLNLILNKNNTCTQ